MKTTTTDPRFQRVRIDAFDPAVSLDTRTAVVHSATIALPWKKLDPGPGGEYIEVIDIDPASGGSYLAANRNEMALLVKDGYAPSYGAQVPPAYCLRLR